MLDTILTVVAVLVLAGATVFLYIKRKNERPDVVIQEKMTMDKLINEVKIVLADKFKDEFFFGKDDAEWEEAYTRKQRLQRASAQCVYGIDSAKIMIKGLIKSILRTMFKTEDDIGQVINFNGFYNDPMVKWEILMYYMKKEHGKDAMKYLVHTYKWNKIRRDIEDGTVPTFAVTVEDLEEAYASEVRAYIPYGDQLDILATIVFTKYKGFGCIDTLREMNIDGINCGVSGAILTNTNGENEEFKASRSVWIYFEGKYMHLRFLTFYTEEELRRVVLLVCRYNTPGPLTEKRGYIINTMYDKSRVLAVRPNAGEYWGLFIRKFTIPKVDLESLYIKEDDPTNAVLPITTVKFIMRTLITTAFTGRQGCGKTTGLIGGVKYLDGRYNIRVLEAAPEMYLRDRYPGRNIYSVAETQYVSMEELQDALKKSDGGISIIGEVATSAVAARMIQLGQAASEVTYFTHHAKRTKDLVYSLRNSLVEAGNFNNMLTAEQQVVDVVKLDVHMDMDVDGFRYIERITEIIKLDEAIPYPVIDEERLDASMANITREYYYRQTDRSSFTTQDIIRFNKETRKYEVVGWFSDELVAHMMHRLPEEYRGEFKSFVQKYWG